jgi:hypothetical protein
MSDSRYFASKIQAKKKAPGGKWQRASEAAEKPPFLCGFRREQRPSEADEKYQKWIGRHFSAGINLRQINAGFSPCDMLFESFTTLFRPRTRPIKSKRL